MAGKRILIIKLSSLGDILHAMPFLRLLRKEHPDAFIAWAVQTGEELLKHDRDLNEVIHIGRGKGFFGGIRWVKDVKKLLRSYSFDAAVDLQGLAKSGLVAMLSGAPDVVGFEGKNCRELNWLFTNHRYEPSDTDHVAAQNLALLEYFGIEEPVLDIPGIATSTEDETAVSELLLKLNRFGDPVVIVNPGVSRENKRWPEKHVVSLCRLLKEQTEHMILLTCGSQAEYESCLRIREDAGEERIRAVPRISLGQFTALAKRADCFIGNDTGPTHIAFSCGVKTVFLFGSTGPWRNGGYESESGTCINITSPSECIECWEKRCRKKTFCMELITPESVMDAVRKLLADTEPKKEP